ncbi:hypothetical protein DFH01_11415 [Falsiroseomonas bella]|uniref:Uncharacterized protein n=2 Tax=Falsiroseomonas bella TaxID=2184016 RepID=A0A317FF86_9PROT|nr:hypothetical protein DFH01_11415 [Falsiroseomonas bella]
MVAGPIGMAAGLVVATGVAAGVAIGAGVVGAALIGRRVWEERQGWRAGTAGTEEPLAEPAPDAPLA